MQANLFRNVMQADLQGEKFMSSTILATFDTLDAAHRAIQDLTDAGFKRSDIGLAVYDPNKEYLTVIDEVDGAEGAAFGATVGSIFGAVVGLASIIIPGIGPIVAAGPLAAALGAATGAGIGAISGGVTGGITGALVHLGVADEDVDYYAESLRRGAALVSVTVHEPDAERAIHILQSHHPIDIDRRIAQWRMRGWEGFDPMVEGYRPEAAMDAPPAEEDDWDAYAEDEYKRNTEEDDYVSGVRHYYREQG
jgi:hypothetical protein